MGSPTGRAVVAAATLGSGMAMLDGTVVNVALRTIGKDLHASLAQLQWITNAYLLLLASLILMGGSFGDRFGRRRVFVVGVVWFAVASLICGVAPSPEVLIAARALQGIGGALLTPGSLAMIQGAFAPEDRAPAIGAWSGLGSIAAAVGPFVGGALVDYASWRWIFLLNLPIAALTVLVAVRSVPETRDPNASSHFDVAGAVLAALALGGTTYALIEWGGLGGWIAAILGVVAGVAFVLVEAHEPEPMLRLELFHDLTFSASNVMTLLVYGALGALTFFVVIQLQTVSGWSALSAGAAFVPMTIIMLFLAARGGRLGQRIGPRIPMTVGPLVMALGTLGMLRIGPDVSYVRDVLPAVVVFGLGLAMMVAPLTATVLAAAPDENAGIASGVNNAVARAGSLLAVAALPIAVGLRGADYADPAVFDQSFQRAMIACAGLLAAGGLVSWFTVRRPEPTAVAEMPA
ncbi:drug resistance transporter, EmrB/QacA subfamily [Nocardioides terrae]|uniref:Drug resistance transporter, EmrB/QacA subfamily n=2 Tax=Nocardioides terrae TaxID=574651 RepID=A0A1I1JUA0_9ACTN|nr:drug resistance transporter, EmrB/QacA subfamily [Nocardioides terrae]